jgi:hypothetical protein
MSTALLLLGAAGVAESGSFSNLTPATNVSEKSYGRVTQIFKKFGSHLQILGFIWVTRSKFHNGDPMLLGANVQNVTLDLCIPGK